MKVNVSILFLSLLLTACEKPEVNPNRQSELLVNDDVLAKISNNAKRDQFTFLFSIDHSRLAKKSGEDLDASKAVVYSNALLNSQLLKENIRVGLDLPYRVQAFHHNGQSMAIYTDSVFLKKRHSLVNEELLGQIDNDLQQLTQGIANIKKVTSSHMDKNYGIVELDSSLDFDSTIKSLKKTVMAEGDTVWFYTLDYQKEASEHNIVLGKATLLVFGAPAPGAKAMRDFPSIGLDAFGQKVLVYEAVNVSSGVSEVKVIYNDIPALAELHYQDNAIAHKVIKFRLKKTLSSAL